MSYLTPRQRDVLEFVVERADERSVPPTLQEVADRFRFTSTATAQKHVNQLVEKGYLVRIKHQRRGLEVTALARQALRGENLGEETQIELPLLGAIAAGAPIMPFEQHETVPVPSAMVGSGDHYALRVRGESMRDEGILDGDTVVVRQSRKAREGETVVALLGDEATLKKLRRPTRDTIGLEPANPAFDTLVVPASDVMVQGVVVGLLRRY
jgi:repressor LexA